MVKCYILCTKWTNHSANFGELSAWIKIHQILVIFKSTNCFFFKSYKVLAKKVQKSYLSWHWRVMQSLKKNWLVISNMTWGIWWILTCPTTEKSKNFTSMGYFCPKYMKFELKKNIGVIFQDTEQWFRIWINPDLVFSKMV